MRDLPRSFAAKKILERAILMHLRIIEITLLCIFIFEATLKLQMFFCLSACPSGTFRRNCKYLSSYAR